MRSLVTSIFLYACESWTLTAELQRRIQAIEMRCYRNILRISHKDHVTNEDAARLILRAPRDQHLSYSNFTGSRFLNGSNTKLPACFTTQSLVPPRLNCRNYCNFTTLPALSVLHRTHACSNSNLSTAKLKVFALSPTYVLTSGTISPKTSETNSRHFSFLSISLSNTALRPNSLHIVCVCVCVCVCGVS